MARSKTGGRKSVPTRKFGSDDRTPPSHTCSHCGHMEQVSADEWPDSSVVVKSISTPTVNKSVTFSKHLKAKSAARAKKGWVVLGPGVVRGASSILDLGGTFKMHKIQVIAVGDAIGSDWAQVGSDMSFGLSTID